MPGTQRVAPCLAIEKHLLRLHRLIGRRAKALTFETVDAGLIVFLDLREPLLNRLVRAVIKTDACRRHIFEHRFKSRMIERQPVLLALIAPSARHRFVQRIVSRVAAEQRYVSRAKQRRRSFAERHFADRHQREFCNSLHRSLRLGVESLDAFEIVAKEIEP